MKELSFLTQDFLVAVSSSNIGDIDRKLNVSQLNKIKERPNTGPNTLKIHFNIFCII